MKDLDLVMHPQVEMLEDRYGIMRQKITWTPIKFCETHPFAKEEDLIDVLVKKTNEVVKRCRYCERMKQINKLEAKKEWEIHKQEVTDYYVRRSFSHSKSAGKRLKMHEIPSELVEAKQAVIKLKRMVDKLNAPLKKCEKHGYLYINDVIKSGKTKAGTPQYKCRQCMQEIHKRNYQMNKLIIKEKHKKYRLENKEKIKQIKKESFQKHGYKYLPRENERKRLHDLKGSAELNDRYVKKLIVKRTTLSMSDVSPEMIECVRAIHLLKRKVKSKQKSQKLFGLKEKMNDKD